jgi:hypothetical protein
MPKPRSTKQRMASARTKRSWLLKTGPGKRTGLTRVKYLERKAFAEAQEAVRKVNQERAERFRGKKLAPEDDPVYANWKSIVGGAEIKKKIDARTLTYIEYVEAGKALLARGKLRVFAYNPVEKRLVSYDEARTGIRPVMHNEYRILINRKRDPLHEALKKVGGRLAEHWIPRFERNDLTLVEYNQLGAGLVNFEILDSFVLVPQGMQDVTYRFRKKEGNLIRELAKPSDPDHPFYVEKPKKK